MIGNVNDIRIVRPVSENIDDDFRLMPYMMEVELNRVLPVIGAKLYRQFDNVINSDIPPATEFITYISTNGAPVQISIEQNDVIFNGGYFKGCGCDDEQHTRGLKAAIVYFTYSEAIRNGNVNLTAFGAREQKLTFSQPLGEDTIARADRQAEKIGYAILGRLKEYLTSLGLYGGCCDKKKYRPEKFKSIYDNDNRMF